MNLEGEIDPDDEIDSGEAIGDGDEETYKGIAFRGSKAAHRGLLRGEMINGHGDGASLNEDNNGFSDMKSEAMGQAEAADRVNGYADDSAGISSGSEEGDRDAEDIGMEDPGSLSSEAESLESEKSSSNANGSFKPAPSNDDRVVLRKLMAESQKVITTNLSQAAKVDVAKGRAIRHQRTAFDSLLNTRIRLQKALVATNSLSSGNFTPPGPHEDPAVKAAEKAALRLWSTLDSLRQSISLPSSLPAPKPVDAYITIPLSTLWTRMKAYDTRYRDHGLKTLNKWSLKTAPISSLPRANKFSATPKQQPLSTVLEQQLNSQTNMEKLMAKTRVPRSCAPVQAAALSSRNHNDDTDNLQGNELPFYDDADFYSLLLRDLLDSRSSQPSTTLPIQSTIPGIRDPTLRVHKKAVDTKASKGRKMRYTVHEKLQNFMAPEDRSTWGERQASELFAGLLGRKVVGLDEEMESIKEDGEEEGLKLFRR